MKQIIALGGGGYDTPDELALHRYVIDQCNISATDRPKTCLLGQAGGEHPDWTQIFHDSFGAMGCDTAHLSLFFPHTKDIADFLQSQDLIFVGGGNTKSMLALWREWGLDEILRSAWEAGTVLAGVSAGTICWFEQGSTDSIAGELGPLDGLGFLPGSCCPHYSLEPQRRPTYHAMIRSGQLAAGHAVDDLAAAHFVDDDLKIVASARGDACVYYVEHVDDAVVERVVDAERVALPPYA